MVNKPTDNLAFKDDKEKQELQDKVRSQKLALEVRIGIYTLIALGVGFAVFCFFQFS